MVLQISKTGLIAIALLTAVGGATAAMAAGFGPLAYISYNIQGANEGQGQIIPTHINLGNLTPGSSGTVTANATVTISKSGNYTFKLLHQEKLEKVFKTFDVNITIGSKTVLLSLEHDEATVSLQNGTYTVFITIHYVVSKTPKSEHVSNEPLIVFHPAEEENETQD
jgi:hypothetical protein